MCIRDSYTAYGCLAAGLFEETGRLMGLSLLCKKDRDLALGCLLYTSALGRASSREAPREGAAGRPGAVRR